MTLLLVQISYGTKLVGTCSVGSSTESLMSKTIAVHWYKPLLFVVDDPYISHGLSF